MAWETRGDRRYFYRSYRAGGRVLRAYFGTGPAAVLAADRIAVERAAQVEESALLHVDRAQQEPAERAFESLTAATQLALAAELLAAGFQRYHRGAWRRRRVPIGD
jgi:hypothetical protein